MAVLQLTILERKINRLLLLNAHLIVSNLGFLPGIFEGSLEVSLDLRVPGQSFVLSL